MRNLYNSRQWKTLVSLALCMLVAVIVLEQLFPHHQFHSLLAFLDLCAITVLGTNLAIGYSLAPYKDSYLRQHALELIALMPLWGMLRLAEYDYLALRLFRTTSHFGLFENVDHVLGMVKYRFS
ncbi:hypothetical protein DRN67_03215 [Candidatus Micrarchaeota archaeon]|nr:MAG: hypothetical protein DRN67_03215 [Candidatus Micrarchaeota archaeon]